MLPVVTVTASRPPSLGGLIVTETVFTPRRRALLVEAGRWRDYPMVRNQMFIAIVVVSINFIIDMLYAALDPRIVSD
jgi:peptide/nickel transport system permease protein